MNPYLRWYSRLAWFGLIANIIFAGFALWAPSRLQRGLRLHPLVATIWLRNVGMLLALVSIFNAGAALAPTRYPLYSYLVCVARLIAGSFFFRVVIANPLDSSDRPRAFVPLGVFDTSMGLACALLLTLGLRRNARTDTR